MESGNRHLRLVRQVNEITDDNSKDKRPTTTTTMTMTRGERRKSNRGNETSSKLAGTSKANLYVKKTSLIVGTIITSVTRCG